ncbi:hypothetical protein CHGG_03381 [Chaetomium globosum CBS 148.51]|uniref:N-acetyltransferase domain-containing protein n=1 Tax=Chaetomium globosum (strain ATCC 6205 / CBS 148.51 / DSM 1962 / NBRC 6347 / NRRL 1970) TaxID=306901 RepID=Q2H8S3_CHAGB|nr:uncharacterized protein CHGG_03381 [Chaetomium globosum CBS 148.51]EAQ91446.1 hypothetical protein CHGG_03381 [Chaetomium globosum CBS 148.51]
METTKLSAGLSPKEAHNLDSPDLENAFLSAIGFARPAKSSIELQNVPTTTRPTPQPPKAQNPPQPTAVRTRQARMINAPELTNTYWDAQRITKGIVDLSMYPVTGTRVIWSKAAQWPDLRSLDLESWEQPDEPMPTYSAPVHQSFLPANPNPRYRAPEARENSYPPKSPSLSSGTDTSEMSRSRGGGHRGRGRRGGGRKEEDVRTTDGERDVIRPPRLDQMDLDLRQYRLPRPNKNYAGSSYSLPSLGSGFNVSDTGVDTRAAEGTDTDVRNTIGLPHRIYASGNSWTVYGLRNESGRNEEEIFTEKSYLESFIGAWQARIPQGPVVTFDKSDTHWRCDIDTLTGNLREPISHPDSTVGIRPQNPQEEWRRQIWSTALSIKKYNEQRSGRPGGDRRRNTPMVLEFEGPATINENLPVVVHEPVIERPEFHRFVPRIPSFLRPAEKYDMEAVRAIYNWEVEHGIQALDSQPVTVEEFEKILATTQQLGLPFLVAVRGSARNLGMTNCNTSFSVFKQVPFNGEKRGEILGFAFLSVWQPGLGGTALGSSRATGKINVFVHPEYKRKKIGFSLLDMLLTTVSDCFSSEAAYDFIDADNSPVYKKTRDRKRHFKVYLSYRIPHKSGWDEKAANPDDLVWVKKLVQDNLNFTELVRFEAVHRTPKGRKDPVCWLDEVVFEHTCAFGPGAVDPDY